MPLIDRFGRQISNLRISLTTRCNLNCIYCHHEGELATENSVELTPEEIERFVRVCSQLGITSVKLTGGEPLLRKDICEIVARIARHVADISMTTNGLVLAELAKKLKSSGLNRLNISLDTLDARKFRYLTGKDLLFKVIEGVEAASSAGLRPVKLNTVCLKNINDDEIDALMKFAHRTGAILQLIELETCKECVNTDFYRRYHIDMTSLSHKLELAAKYVRFGKMHNRKKYFIQLDGTSSLVEVELVTPMHNTEFCAHCTRLRLTSDGKLKPCLLRADNHIDILPLLRNGRVEEIKSAVLHAVELREPYWK